MNFSFYIGHDSSVAIANGSTKRTDFLRLPNLPFLSVLFINANTFLAAGYDCWPAVFRIDPTAKM